jgi:hypothetical protein
MSLPQTLLQGGTRYFPRGTDVIVLKWCSANGLNLETLATRTGIPRVNLSLMLKGVDPVPTTMEKKIRAVIDGQ